MLELRRIGFIALVGLVASSCASAASSGAPDAAAGPVAPGSVQIVVNNNLFNGEERAILLAGGVQRQLGSVPPNSTRTFTAELQPREYELQARGLTGTTTISFSLFANTTRVTWDMEGERISQSSR